MRIISIATLLFFVSLFFNAGCSENVFEQPSISVADSSGIRVVTNDLGLLSATCVVELKPSLAIGKTDGEEPYLLHRVFGAARLSDGRIALVNQGSNELRYYDASGTFLRTSGRDGEGPGEFKAAFNLWKMPNDEVWVGDFRPWEIEVFDTSGNWIRQINTEPEYLNPPGRIGVLDDGHILLGIQNRSTQTDDFGMVEMDFVIHQISGEFENALVTVPNGRWGIIGSSSQRVRISPLFESYAQFSARGFRYAIGDGRIPEINVYDGSSKLTPQIIVKWTGIDQIVTQAHIHSAHEKILNNSINSANELTRMLIEIRTGSERPIADQFPAFSDVEIGPDESIWIQLYSKPGEAPGQKWVHFASDGTFECRASLHEDLEVYEFGTDYILGKQKGESGEERVVIYNYSDPF